MPEGMVNCESRRRTRITRNNILLPFSSASPSLLFASFSRTFSLCPEPSEDETNQLSRNSRVDGKQLLPTKRIAFQKHNCKHFLIMWGYKRGEFSLAKRSRRNLFDRSNKLRFWWVHQKVNLLLETWLRASTEILTNKLPQQLNNSINLVPMAITHLTAD